MITTSIFVHKGVEVAVRPSASSPRELVLSLKSGFETTVYIFIPKLVLDAIRHEAEKGVKEWTLR